MPSPWSAPRRAKAHPSSNSCSPFRKQRLRRNRRNRGLAFFFFFAVSHVLQKGWTGTPILRPASERGCSCFNGQCLSCRNLDALVLTQRGGNTHRRLQALAKMRRRGGAEARRRGGADGKSRSFLPPASLRRLLNASVQESALAVRFRNLDAHP